MIVQKKPRAKTNSKLKKEVKYLEGLKRDFEDGFITKEEFDKQMAVYVPFLDILKMDIENASIPNKHEYLKTIREIEGNLTQSEEAELLFKKAKIKKINSDIDLNYKKIEEIDFNFDMKKEQLKLQKEQLKLQKEQMKIKKEQFKLAKSKIEGDKENKINLVFDINE